MCWHCIFLASPADPHTSLSQRLEEVWKQPRKEQRRFEFYRFIFLPYVQAFVMSYNYMEHTRNTVDVEREWGSGAEIALITVTNSRLNSTRATIH